MGMLPPTGLPAQAPAVLWVAMITALAAWWCWPWLAAILDKNKSRPPSSVRAAREVQIRLAQDISETPVLSELSEGARKAPAQELRQLVVDAADASSEWMGDPKAVFEEAFAAVAAHVGLVLQGPPKGATYLSAVSALYFFVGIVDKIFQSWGTPEVQKVSRLRATSAKFQQAFGNHPQAEALLRAAGFRHVRDDAVERDDDVWYLPLDSPDARLKALAAKLCLVQVQERQKARGARRWIDECNSDVLPRPEEASLGETLLLYRKAAVTQMEAAFGGVPSAPSMRERNCEIAVRIKMNARRAELGVAPVEQHEGLLCVARAVAHAQRCRLRMGKQLPPQELDSEVRKLLPGIALPPAVSLAHLHFTSQELPRIFGLTSTTGAGPSSDNAQDQAAELIANEAFGFWKVRQQMDVDWPAAVICGIGTALDYTLNKGVLCMLLIGYEDAPLQARSAAQKDSSEGLKQRAAKTSQNARSFGARVATFDSLGAPPPAKRG